MKKIFAITLAVLMAVSLLLGCGKEDKATNTGAAKPAAQTQSQSNGSNKVKPETAKEASGAKVSVDKDKAYTDKDHVAAYIHTYKRLPHNYITKHEATKLGWKQKGTLDKVAPGKSIGGDHFGNFEKLVPEKNGRKWQECDIDYVRGNRGPKRIVFSNDGLIYYSASHYKDFVKMY